MAAKGYDPSRSRNDPDKLASFIAATITGDLTEVPGIGPSGADKLAAAGINYSCIFLLI